MNNYLNDFAWKPYAAGLLLLAGMLSGSIRLAAQSHPDKVYPLPDNYRSVNEGGVNLVTGDLNLDFSLAALSGSSVSYDISLFYNSISAGLPTINNSVGGHGWKLMDYPKVVKDGASYYYLDGQRSYLLKSSSSSGATYHTEAPYYRWEFTKGTGQDTWTVRTGDGMDYHLEHTSTESGYTFYHLSRLEDRSWGDQLDFTYSAGKLTAVSNRLGDALTLAYDGSGHLTGISNTHEQVIRHQVLLEYTNGRLSDIKGISRLPTGLFTEDVKALHFNYNTEERIHEIISPSGDVRQYVYYTGANHPELVGKIIRYSTDNGYLTHTLAEDQPDGEDQDAIYSALWYNLGNDREEEIYRLFNKVRVYPGGFHENDPHVNYEDIANPFGHQNHYFFNGEAGSSLLALPDGYAGTDVTDQSLRGMSYRLEQYNDNGLTEEEEHLIRVDKSIYALESSHHPSNNVSVPILAEERMAQDGVKEQATWFEYDSAYHLLTAVISSRQNPTADAPDKKEYQKTSVRYAYEDYPEMASRYLLTPVSQQYSATAAYSGGTPYTDSGLAWEVTDASLTTWKDWAGADNWAPEFSYQLRQQLGESAFPVNLAGTPGEQDWLQTAQILVRTVHGDVLASKDLYGNVASTLYDSLYETYPVADFYHADTGNGEAGYLGFESYESGSAWNLANGKDHLADAHTGYRSLKLNGNLKVKATAYQPPSNTAYLWGAFIKNTGALAGSIGFLQGSSWQVSRSIEAGSEEWTYYQVVMEVGNAAAVPAIECSDCLVDDIHFHPLDAPFSATVYEVNKSTDDNLTVNQAGNYKANHTVTLAAATAIAADEALRVQAGERITFEQGASIAEGAMVSLSLFAPEENLNKPLATLGGNGDTWRRVYNAVEEPVALTGPAGSVKTLTLQYHSREGIALFGDSDPGDPYFDENHPHATLQVVPRQESVAEEFQFATSDRFPSLSGMVIEEGLLKVNNSSSASASFSRSVSATDYALHVEIIPEPGFSGGRLTLQIEDIRLNLEPENLLLRQKNTGSTTWSTLKSVSIEQPPQYLSLLLVVMDGNHLFAYADGRLLFDHTLNGPLTGAVRLTAENTTGAFDNFMYLEDPVIGKKTFDALGQVRQSLVHQGPDKLFVTEMLYGDALNLPLAVSRGTHVSTGDARGLEYRHGFASLQVTDNSRGGTLSVSGEVQQAHGYNTPFVASHTYDNDPGLRSDRSGSGGKFAAGASYSVDHAYDGNQGEHFGFEANSLQKTTDRSPHTEGQEVTHQTYAGPGTGAVFAATATDHETGVVHQEQIHYDEQMRLRQHLQPNYFGKREAGFYTETDYDYLGNVVYERDPDAGTSQYAYDRKQRLRVMLDAAGTAADTAYYQYRKYDDLGRVAEEGLYEGDINLTYDVSSTQQNQVAQAPGILRVNTPFGGTTLELQAGELISFEQGFSIAVGKTMTTEIVSGLMNQALASAMADDQWPLASDPSRKVKHTYRYDRDEGNTDNPAVGRLVSVATYDTPGGTDYNTERYTYDLEGRITGTRQEISEGGATITDAFAYTYDQTGQMTGITHDTDASTSQAVYEVRYTYDRMGRVSRIGNGEDPEAYAAYAYDNDGMTESLGKQTDGTYALSVRYGMNEEGLPDSIEARKQDGELLFEESLFYIQRQDGSEGYYNGLIAGLTYASGPSSGAYDYHYDGFGRLARREDNDGPTDYRYDANGNLQEKDGQPYSYKVGNNQVAAGQGGAYAYDALGRVTTLDQSGGATTFSYGPFTHLAREIRQPDGSTIIYRYGGDNQRIKKVTAGQTIRYFRGLNDYPLIETVAAAGGTSTYSYVYGPTGLLAVGAEGPATAAVRYLATMETEEAASEERVFSNLPATRAEYAGTNRSLKGSKVARLDGSRPVGPALMLPVSAGDKVGLEALASYPGGHDFDASMGVAALAGEVAAAFDHTNGSREGARQLYEGLNDAMAALFGAGQDHRKEVPAASLNYLLLDEGLNYMDGGFVKVTEAARGRQEQLSIPEWTVPKTGYLYVFVSDESETTDPVYFDNLAVVHTLGGGANYVVKDHLSSVRVLANEAGEPTARYEYDAFGEEVAQLPSSLEMRYLYTGQEYEAETGLYNYRARLYNPVLGRFYAPDLLGQQNSAYAYAGNNPISYTDPDGAWFGLDDLFAATVGAVVGAATELVSEAASGHGINWSKVGVAAAAGAAEGETTLYAGPVAGAAVGAGLNQLGDNLVDGKRGWEALDGVAAQATAGAATAGALQLAGKGISKVAGRFASEEGEALARNEEGKLLRSSPCGCFTKGTLVKTGEGEKPIQAIQTGDQVWAYNEATGEQELKVVLQTFTLTREATYTLQLGEETLTTTSDHPFYTGNEWVTAAMLKAGDSVLSFESGRSVVTAIDVTAGYTRVYNFEVEGLHNYYVGEDGVLVHNTGKCDQNFRKNHVATTKKAAKRQAGERIRRGDVVGTNQNGRPFNTSVDPRDLSHGSRNAINPRNGNVQYSADNVKTFQVKIDKRGRPKRPRLSNKKVFMDKKHGQIHHLDGAM